MLFCCSCTTQGTASTDSNDFMKHPTVCRMRYMARCHLKQLLALFSMSLNQSVPFNIFRLVHVYLYGTSQDVKIR